MRKKFLAALLALCMVVALLPTAAMAAEFSDVEGHWGEAAIERWAEYDVFDSGEDGTFNPNGQMTRAEFAMMLASLMGYTKTSGQAFSDLDPDEVYAEAISKLVAAGIMDSEDGKVNPLGLVSREAAAVMLCRAFDIKPTGASSLTFSDSASASDWAVDALTALAERGMINGVGGNLLDPTGIIDRASVAQLCSNMIAEYVTEDKVITGEVKGVVVVVNGAKADIQNATLSTSLVVENASATLTNTTAQNVKVEGTNSAITSDEKSTVTDVSLGGTNAKAELKGTVSGAVTIEEGATGVTASVPAGTEVANESGAAATVNGSTVAAGESATVPEPTPSTPAVDDDEDDDEDDTPVTPPAENKPTNPTHTHNYAGTPEKFDGAYHSIACVDDEETEVTGCGDIKLEPHDADGEGGVCSKCGYKAAANQDNITDAEGSPCTEHSWVADPDSGPDVDATCQAAGTQHLKCENDGCTAKNTVTIAKLEHTYTKDSSASVAATCGAAGKDVYVCSTCESGEGHTKEVPVAATGQHKWDNGVVKTAGTCKTEGVKTFTCTVCNTTQDVNGEKDSNNHEWGAGWEKDENSHWHQCTNEEHSTVKKDVASHVYDQEEGTKCVCGAEKPTETETPPASEHEHNYSEWTSNNDGTHTRTCDGAGTCNATASDLTQDCADGDNDGKCDACKATVSSSGGGGGAVGGEGS